MNNIRQRALDCMDPEDRRKVEEGRAILMTPQPRPSETDYQSQIDELKALVGKLLAEKRLKERDEAPVPTGLEDVIDWTAPPKERQEKLQQLYAELMSAREHALSYNDRAEAMKLLRRAERVHTGIKWNTPKLAEQI